jgi:hypothetical protein
VRVWIDLTNSPHVPIFAPLVRRMQARGWDVSVTARAFAQTISLLELHGIEHTVVGHHGGGSRLGKARAAADRVTAMTRFGRRGRFDLALAHGSTDLPMACRALRVPNTTMFDYEYARLQHGLNCRLAQRVLMPDAIPPERVAVYGARPPKLVVYPGLKEEYYLADFRPDAAVPAALGLDGERIGLVLRPPAELALYHRFETPLFDALLEQVGRAIRCAGWCCRAPDQASGSGRWRCPRCWCRSRRWTARAWWRAPICDQRWRHHEPRGGGAGHAGLRPSPGGWAGRRAAIADAGCARWSGWRIWYLSANRPPRTTASGATPTG